MLASTHVLSQAWLLWSEGPTTTSPSVRGAKAVAQMDVQFICKNRHKVLIFVYDMGMATLEHYLDDHLMHGRGYFTRTEALAALDISPEAFGAAVTRLIKKGRLANPKHGFYLILRPEDKVAGAPDPLRWIDPLMQHLNLDYRVSLLLHRKGGGVI